MRILLKVLYWLAVLAISVALVIGLILWFESQDASEIEDSGGTVLPIMPV
jgi:cytochrome b subunit of formate dehydrogenase